MKVKFLTAMETEAGRLPAGTLLEHPDCFLHADIGNAVAQDAEAEQAVEKWRALKPKPGDDPRHDPRPSRYKFAGAGVPAKFTLPDGTVHVVSRQGDELRIETTPPDKAPVVTEELADA